MRGWIAMAGALAGLSLAAPASAQPGSGAATLVLTNANVVNVRTGAIDRGVTVTIVSGRIEAIGRGPAPPAGRVIDLKGRYLVPGLIDAHTHLQSIRQARTALESGVTTVRSASVGSFRDVALRDLVRRGALPGPDVVPAGLFVSPRFGEDDILADPEVAELRPGADTAEKARALVRINLKHGVGVIKTRGTERAGLPDTDPRQQSYTEDVLRAIVEEASAGGVPVEAHAHGDEGAMAAVKAGVRSIEHGTYLSDETLKLMKEKGTFLVPTYSTVVDLVEPGGDYDHPALQLRGRHMLPRLADTIRRAHRLGVRIATGADTSYGPQSVTRIAHEVAAFVELGLSPLEALQSATIVAAELLGLERSTGAIEAGLEADLIAVDGNPLENVILLQDPLLVVSNGVVVVDRLEFGKP
jgi:imidazolonepropionase-like amidohydrolase